MRHKVWQLLPFDISKNLYFSCISKVEIISGLLAGLRLQHQVSDIKTLTMETDSVPGTMAYWDHLRWLSAQGNLIEFNLGQGFNTPAKVRLISICFDYYRWLQSFGGVSRSLRWASQYQNLSVVEIQMQVRQRIRYKEIIQIASHRKRFYWI